MPTATEQLSAEQIIASLHSLSLSDLELVFDQVLALQAERRQSHLPGDESALLAKINEGLPEGLRARMSQLRGKRQTGAITEEEYSELTTLSDRAEEMHAERMSAIADLARLRGVTLAVLMNQLGIRFPQNA